jgi:hypothetical protein
VRAFRCLNCKATCTTYRPTVPTCGRCHSGPAWQVEIYSDEPAPLPQPCNDGKVRAGGNTDEAEN